MEDNMTLIEEANETLGMEEIQDEDVEYVDDPCDTKGVIVGAAAAVVAASAIVIGRAIKKHKAKVAGGDDNPSKLARSKAALKEIWKKSPTETSEKDCESTVNLEEKGVDEVKAES